MRFKCIFNKTRWFWMSKMNMQNRLIIWNNQINQIVTWSPTSRCFIILCSHFISVIFLLCYSDKFLYFGLLDFLILEYKYFYGNHLYIQKHLGTYPVQNNYLWMLLTINISILLGIHNWKIISKRLLTE